MSFWRRVQPDDHGREQGPKEKIALGSLSVVLG